MISVRNTHAGWKPSGKQGDRKRRQGVLPSVTENSPREMRTNLPEALKNCACVVRVMEEMGMRYQDACKEAAKRDGRTLGTFRDSCTRFGKGGTNTFSVAQVETLVERGEIVDALIHQFPDHRDWIQKELTRP